VTLTDPLGEIVPPVPETDDVIVEDVPGTGEVVAVTVAVVSGPVPKYADVKTTPVELYPVYTITTLDGGVVPGFV
jgi:hypothetical protein